MTVDEDLGLVYLPVESPTSDYYGGERPGQQSFGESLVCVDLKTGKRKWHFQIVHHPIWDYDISSAPILADINVDGKAIKAVALPSKEAFLYVFDRVTGKPVWPIEERPVPQSDVPGEKTSPTQPFPTKPPAYARNYINVPDDLIDFTPEMRAQAQGQHGALSRPDPCSCRRWSAIPKGFWARCNLGNASGGTNWPGAGYDPETHIVYAQAQSIGAVRRFRCARRRRDSPTFTTSSGRNDTAFRVAEGPGFGSAADAPQRNAAPRTCAGRGRRAARRAVGALTVQGLPLVKPPYGVISAINLDRGDTPVAGALWRDAGQRPQSTRR